MRVYFEFQLSIISNSYFFFIAVTMNLCFEEIIHRTSMCVMRERFQNSDTDVLRDLINHAPPKKNWQLWAWRTGELLRIVDVPMLVVALTSAP